MTIKNDFHANPGGAEFTFYHSVSRHIADVHVVRFYDLRVTKHDLAPFLTLCFVLWTTLFTEWPEEGI